MLIKEQEIIFNELLKRSNDESEGIIDILEDAGWADGKDVAKRFVELIELLRVEIERLNEIVTENKMNANSFRS